MCAVSMLMDYGNQFPLQYWQRPAFDEFQKLIHQAEIFDQKTGQPNCEDPEKVALLQRIEQHLKTIEERLDRLEKPERKRAQRPANKTAKAAPKRNRTKAS